MAGHNGMKKRIVLAALAILFSSTCPAAQEPGPDFTEFEKAVQAEMQSRGIPGAAVAIVRGDRVIYAKGFGVVSVGTTEAVTPKTLFRLGSTTKTLVGLAIGNLVVQGKLRMNAPLRTYAPKLLAAVGALTLEQLLTHTAGLKDDVPMRGPLEETALAARVEAWDGSVFFTEPGRVMSYSNPGYALAGYVIERVTGKPFAEAMRELVLQPVGMRASTFRPLEAATYPLAQGHERTAEGPVVVRPMAEHAGNYPPGSLFSSADEMARLLIALLNDGRVGDAPGLPPQQLAWLQSRAVEAPGLRDARYGFGAFRAKVLGLEVVQNVGARLGYGSAFVMVPEHKVAVFLVANRSSALMQGPAVAALRVLIPGLQPPAQTAPQPAVMTEQERNSLAGKYVHGNSIPDVTLALAGEKLMVQFVGREFEVTKVSDGTFRARGAAELESFVVQPGAAGGPQFLCAQTRCLARRP